MEHPRHQASDRRRGSGMIGKGRRGRSLPLGGKHSYYATPNVSIRGSYGSCHSSGVWGSSRLSFRNDVLDDFLSRRVATHLRIMNSQARFLATSEQISRTAPFILVFIVLIVFVVVIVSSAERAQCRESLLLLRLLGRGARGSILGGGASVESSGSRILWLGSSSRGGILGVLVLVGVESRDSGTDLPVRAYKVLSGLRGSALEAESAVDGAGPHLFI